MRELGGFLGRHAVHLGGLDELRAAGAFLVESVDPLAKAQVVFADGFRGDEDVVAGLFKVSARQPEETEAFGGEFEQSVSLDLRAGEQRRAAVFGVVGGGLLKAAVVALAAMRGLLGLAVWWLLTLVSAAFALVAAAFATAFDLLPLAPTWRPLGMVALGAALLGILRWTPWGRIPLGRSFGRFLLAWVGCRWRGFAIRRWCDGRGKWRGLGRAWSHWLAGHDRATAGHASEAAWATLGGLGLGLGGWLGGFHCDFFRP